MKSDLVRIEFSDRAIQWVRYIPSIFGSVLFKVGTNLDITCDSDILECDYFSDSLHSLTKDLTDENETASLTVSGSAELEKLIYSKIIQPQEILHSPVLLQKGLHLLQKLLVRYPLQELQKNLIREQLLWFWNILYSQWCCREIQIQSSWWNYSL